MSLQRSRDTQLHQKKSGVLLGNPGFACVGVCLLGCRDHWMGLLDGVKGWPRLPETGSFPPPAYSLPARPDKALGRLGEWRAGIYRDSGPQTRKRCYLMVTFVELVTPLEAV